MRNQWMMHIFFLCGPLRFFSSLFFLLLLWWQAAFQAPSFLYFFFSPQASVSFSISVVLPLRSPSVNCKPIWFRFVLPPLIPLNVSHFLSPSRTSACVCVCVCPSSCLCITAGNLSKASSWACVCGRLRLISLLPPRSFNLWQTIS